MRNRAVSCGVPQGSVLGPLLWNIGYDWALRGAMLRGLRVVCYADDTLVTAKAKEFSDAAVLATVGVSHMIQRIQLLGLKVALEKTEALYFYGPRRKPSQDAHLRINGVRIEISPCIKYLGLYLDAKWSFREHFRRQSPKLVKTAHALGNLLPNLGGPSSSARRLYTGVVRSMALYGAPVWVDALNAQNKALLRRPQRAMALRVIHGYRTVSFEAACVLAGTPPWELDAEVLASVYEQSAEVRSLGSRAMPEQVSRWRERAQKMALRQWRQRLEHPSAGHLTIGAIRPVLERWVDRKEGGLSFRITQVLTGHGCFGGYLHKIGREPTMECHECGAGADSATHTLAFCPAFDSERQALLAVIGPDLTLTAVAKAMVTSGRSWDAFASFCEDVISRKEEAERAREDDPLSVASRRRRTGRRRRLHGLLHPS